MSSDEGEWNESNDNHDDKDMKAQNGTAAHIGTEDDDDDDDDMPISSLKSTRASKTTAPSYKEDSDDDDDDVPLISLVAKGEPSSSKRKSESKSSKKAPAKKSPDKKKKTTTPTSKASPTKKKAPNSANATSSATTSSSSNKSYEWVSAALYGSGCDKGLLIQRLLCRWWYAYTWPDLDNPIQPIPSLKQYDTLDGFPGVYIGTAAEVVGQLYDTRDASTAPSFRNFAQKSSVELQQLLITGIEEQKRQLLLHLQQQSITSANNDDATIKELDAILKWTRKVNTTKADKDAIAVLKSHGLKL